MATTIEDRVNKLEGVYEHLATKADLAELKADVIKWMVGLMLASAGLAATIALVIQRFASG